MAIECFDKILGSVRGRPHAAEFEAMKNEFDAKLKNGLTEKEQRELGTKLALALHEKLHNELNGLKSKVLPRFDPAKNKYSSPDKSTAVKEISGRYDGLINEEKIKSATLAQQEEQSLPINTEQDAINQKGNGEDQQIIEQATPEVKQPEASHVSAETAAEGTPEEIIVKVKSAEDISTGDYVQWNGDRFKVSSKKGDKFNLVDVNDRFRTIKEAELSDPEFEGKFETKRSSKPKGGEDAETVRTNQGAVPEKGEELRQGSSNSGGDLQQDQKPELKADAQAVEQTGEVTPPAGPPPPPKEAAEKPEDDAEWVAIYKSELTDAETLLKKSPFGDPVTWGKSVEAGLKKLARAANKKGQSLYEAATEKIQGWSKKIKGQIEREGKSLLNPNDEEVAQMAYYRAVTRKRQAELAQDISSPLEVERAAAIAAAGILNDNLETVDHVLRNTGATAGRSFGIRQMLSRSDIGEEGLEIKRMEIAKSQGGEPLTEAQERQIQDLHDQEQKILKKRAALEEKAKAREFERRVKAEVAKRIKEQKLTPQKGQIKAAGKKIASGIRRLKIDTKSRGAQANLFGLGEAAWNSAIEAVALLVEGGATIAEAVKTLGDEGKIKFKAEEDKKGFSDYVTNYNKNAILSEIGGMAEKEKSSTITHAAIAKGLMNDLVRDYIDNGAKGEDVLKSIHKDLKELFPAITESDVRDAYLREGAFELESKTKLNKDRAEAIAEVKSIAKLETDLDDLKAGRETRDRGSKSERSPSDKEQELRGEKASLIKERDEEKKALAKDARDQKRKADKLSELDEKIRNVTQREKLWERNRRKSDKVIDEDISKKERELSEELNKRGIKLERGDEEQVATKTGLAGKYNDRVDGMVASIDQRLESDKLADDEKIALQSAREILSTAKVDTNSAREINNQISKGERTIELARKELSNHPELSDIKNEIQDSGRQFQKEKNAAVQEILLQNFRKNRTAAIDRVTKQIESGEFDEGRKPSLDHKDAEAIKLEIEARKIQSKYRTMEAEARKKTRKGYEKVIDWVQSIYVAQLIGGLVTELKVASSGVIKPTLETVTRATTGQVAGLLFPHLKKATRGEGFSLRQEEHRWKAIFGKITQEQMAGIVKKSQDALDAADRNFDNIRDEAERLKSEHGEESPEYKGFVKKDLTEALNRQQKAALDLTSHSLYEWIGSNSWRDAADVFLHSTSRIEELMGYAAREEFKKMGTGDRIKFVIESMGATHAVLKNFSARGEFAAAFVARLENKMANDIDIRNADELLKTADESFINYQRGKYQEDSFVTNTFNQIIKTIAAQGERNPNWEKYAKLTAGGARAKNPIVRTPINIARDAIVEYAFGLPIAMLRHAGVAFSGLKEAVGDGKEFGDCIKYMHEYISQIDPGKADAIYRAYRKGGFAIGMYALVASGAVRFGGFYNQKEKGKRNPDVGDIWIGGKKLNKVEAKIILHTPLAMPALLYSNYLRVVNKDRHIDETTFDKHWEATKATIHAMADEVPLGREFTNPLKRVSVPFGRVGADISELFDVDKNGDLIKRKPYDFLDIIQYNTGFRQYVPTEAEYNAIKNAHKR